MRIFGLGLLLFFFSFGVRAASINPKNPRALELERRLNLVSTTTTSSQKILFGQQNAFVEGRGWVHNNSDLQRTGIVLPDSDVKKVTGQNPALAGYDFSEIAGWNDILIKRQMREIDRRGGVVTLSWHMRSVIEDGRGDGSAFDTTGNDVKRILYEPQVRRVYEAQLDRLAAFLNELRDVPVVLRLFHEQNASWFWWGLSHSSAAEFAELWRLTFRYLAAKGVDNILIAYSPYVLHGFTSHYLKGYPGDDWVDILGVDGYFINGVVDFWNMGLFAKDGWKSDLAYILDLAERKNKIPAVTEFGNEGLAYPNFWTDYLAQPLKREGPSKGRGFAYAMVWRNDHESPVHFYGPAPGHRDVGNFLQMLQMNLFEFME